MQDPSNRHLSFIYHLHTLRIFMGYLRQHLSPLTESLGQASWGSKAWLCSVMSLLLFALDSRQQRAFLNFMVE